MIYCFANTNNRTNYIGRLEQNHNYFGNWNIDSETMMGGRRSFWLFDLGEESQDVTVKSKPE